MKTVHQSKKLNSILFLNTRSIGFSINIIPFKNGAFLKEQFQRFKKKQISFPPSLMSPKKMFQKTFSRESKSPVGLLPSRKIKKFATQQLKKYMIYTKYLLAMRFTALKTQATMFSDTLCSSKSGLWTQIHSFKSIEDNGMPKLRPHLSRLKHRPHPSRLTHHNRILPQIILGRKKRKARHQTHQKLKQNKNKI